MAPAFAWQDNGHPVVNVGSLRARVSHDHRIGSAPFGRLAPDAGYGKQRMIRQAEPGAGLGSALTLRLGELRYGNEAAARMKAWLPEPAVELVSAGW